MRTIKNESFKNNESNVKNLPQKHNINFLVLLVKNTKYERPDKVN